MTPEPRKPAPLTPAGCNLQDFPYMPLDVRRLLASETWVLASGDERAAAMCLWLESWHQIPAGSLPNNPRMLAHLSQCPKKWPKVAAQALRGWIECDDGRLYHPVVCEKALQAWIEKLIHAISGATGNAKRWEVEIDTAALREQACVAIERLRTLHPQSKSLKKKAVIAVLAGQSAGAAPASPTDRPPIAPGSPKREKKRESEGIGSVPDGTGAEGAAPPPIDERELAARYVAAAGALGQTQDARPREAASALWKGGKSCLWLDAGLDLKQAGALLGDLRGQYGDVVLMNAIVAMCVERPVGPVAWLKRACQLRAGEAAKTHRQGRLEAANAAAAAAYLAGIDGPDNAQTALEAANAAAAAQFLEKAA